MRSGSGKAARCFPDPVLLSGRLYLLRNQDYHLQLQMDAEGFQMQPMVWNWLQTFLVFIKHCPQLQLGLAVTALRAVPWTSTARSEGRGSTAPKSPCVPRFPVESDLLGTGIPAAICNRLRLMVALWGTELSRSLVSLGFSCAVQTRLFCALETSAKLLMGCSCLLSPGLFCVQLLERVWGTPRVGAQVSILQSTTLEVAGRVFKVWELWGAGRFPHSIHYLCILWSQDCTSVHSVFELISNNR